MFGRRVKIDEELYRRISIYARVAGYSSVEEFVTHVLEKEIARFEEAGTEEEIRKRLKGLGYLS